MDIELTAHHQEKAMDAILQQIQKLSTAEKLDLVQALWDDIAQSAETGGVPEDVSEEIQAELLRRSAWQQANPGQGQSLDEIAQKLGIRL